MSPIKPTGEARHESDNPARVLRGAGVGPEVPVAPGMERTPELIVGIPGIWKVHADVRGGCREGRLADAGPP
jgi:non-ribosomal peptide synthetase component F